MRDILFDEKIAGSFHFTPGQAYEEADNGNRSQVHWDMVNIQRPEYGGGEIYFDGKLIRRDGEFLLPQLRSLNRYFSLGAKRTRERVRLTPRRTGRIELNQSDLAIAADLNIRDFEHRCAFDRARTGAGQLHRNVLRTRIQNDRSDFKGR